MKPERNKFKVQEIVSRDIFPEILLMEEVPPFS